jgi:hypothetical protein
VSLMPLRRIPLVLWTILAGISATAVEVHPAERAHLLLLGVVEPRATRGIEGGAVHRRIDLDLLPSDGDSRLTVDGRAEAVGQPAFREGHDKTLEPLERGVRGGDALLLLALANLRASSERSGKARWYCAG